ncbi:MAG: DUF2339 domain-containing protein, partial [Acidobacteriota bacterium]
MSRPAPSIKAARPAALSQPAAGPPSLSGTGRTLLSGAPPPGRPGAAAGGDLEAAIGQIWISRAGLIMVLVALALFLKWAYGRNLISPEVRTALGLLCALGLMALGEFLHRRTSRFHEAFTGAGLAAFYATFFAAYNLYHLFGQTTSFFLMILTTAAAVFFAVRYDAPSIAGMGIIGGFAVPYILPGRAQHLEPVLVYDLILETGLLLTVPRLSRHKNKLLILAVLAGFMAPAPAVLSLDVQTPFWLGYFLLLTGSVIVLTGRQSAARPETARWILGVLAVLPFLTPIFAHQRQGDTVPQVIYLLLVSGGLLLVQRRWLPPSEIISTLTALAALIALASAAGGEASAWWIIGSAGVLAVMTVLATARRLSGPALIALAGGGILGLISLDNVRHVHLALDVLFPAGMLCLSVVPIMIHRRPGPWHLPAVFGSAFLFAPALWWVLNMHKLGAAHGLLMLILAALYADAALLARRLLTRLTLAAAGILFVTLFFPAQFDRATVSIAWAVEAVLLMSIGRRTDLRSIRMGGLVALLLACAHYISLDSHLF